MAESRDASVSGFLLESLFLCLDPVARGGPAQMAMDEALLESVPAPVMRVYRWLGPAVSFGYSQSLAMVRQSHPHRPCVRRWTGGGIVVHDGDWTFSLVVPEGDPLAGKRPLETYRLIHEHIAGAIQSLASGARLTRPEECLPGDACFSAPALHDVSIPDAGKVCGGAQRRTRRGFLHQGSLQGVALPGDFAGQLAARMAAGVAPFVITDALQKKADGIERGRYGSPAWLERIP